MGTRRIAFFARPAEVTEWIQELGSARVVTVHAGPWQTRLFVGLPGAPACPWDSLAVWDLPIEQGEVLYLSVLAVRTSGGQADAVKSQGDVAFARVASFVRRRLVAGVSATNETSGVVVPYRGIRCTELAVAWAGRGLALRQPGVENISFAIA